MRLGRPFIDAECFARIGLFAVCSALIVWLGNMLDQRVEKARSLPVGTGGLEAGVLGWDVWCLELCCVILGEE